MKKWGSTKLVIFNTEEGILSPGSPSRLGNLCSCGDPPSITLSYVIAAFYQGDKTHSWPGNPWRLLSGNCLSALAGCHPCIPLKLPRRSPKRFVSSFKRRPVLTPKAVTVIAYKSTGCHHRDKVLFKRTSVS